MKGQVLLRARAHLKVPGWSLVWNELPTKKLPMFLSRLNEMSGGCEKIVRTVSLPSFYFIVGTPFRVRLSLKGLYA